VRTYQVHLKLTEQPIEHKGINAYEKGSFYCIQISEEKFVKYPLVDIWRTVEISSGSPKVSQHNNNNFPSLSEEEMLEMIKQEMVNYLSLFQKRFFGEEGVTTPILESYVNETHGHGKKES
jgi:hypothetical protein